MCGDCPYFQHASESRGYSDKSINRKFTYSTENLRARRVAVARATAALSAGVLLLAATLAVVLAEPTYPGKTTTVVSTTSVSYVQNMTTIITLTQTTSQSTKCTVLAESGPLYIEILNDSSKSPVVGAQVTATNTPVTCDQTTALDNNFTVMFTTGPARSYSIFGGGSDSSFLVTVFYAGHTYPFKIQLAIESATCASLYLPSGRENVTSGGTFNLTC